MAIPAPRIGTSRLLAALLALLLPFAALADSPLTSTDFASAYGDLPQLQAVRARGLDTPLLDWLLDERTPPDQAVAVINALGFGKDGKGRNSIRLLVRLRETDPKRFAAFRKGQGSGHLLLVVGYAWAMDEYFDTAKAESLLRRAKERLPGSFTVAFVLAMTEAQRRMDGPWCEVYQGPKRVINRWGPHPIDLRRQVIEDTMRYIDLYAEDCR
jgi:hypothetical protein